MISMVPESSTEQISHSFLPVGATVHDSYSKEKKMRLNILICLFVSAFSPFVSVTSASTDEQAMDIPVMAAAVYRAETVWSCCSPSYLVSHNAASLALRWCATQGGYCSTSKRHPFLMFDLGQIAEGAQITSVRLRGTLSSSNYASGFLHFGFSDLSEPSDALAAQIDLQPAGTTGITWTNSTSFNFGLGASSFNAIDRTRYLVVVLGTHHATLSNMRNDQGSAPWIEVTYKGGTPPCTGDLNDSGVVDGVDLALILGFWGSDNATCDLDGSGLVDGADLTIVLGAWGACAGGA
jgi:hypothetical protein